MCVQQSVCNLVSNKCCIRIFGAELIAGAAITDFRVIWQQRPGLPFANSNFLEHIRRIKKTFGYGARKVRRGTI